jgi:hypothetical protein
VSSPELPELRSAELLAALLRRRVQFLVVGGIAAQLHGATRATKDLDIIVPWERDNFDRLAAALEDLDARLDLPPDLGDLEVRASVELIARTSMTRWLTQAGALDVMQEIPAGEHGEPRQYAQLKEHAAYVRSADVNVLVAALDDVIASKEHADRPKDRQALPELHALRDRLTGRHPQEVPDEVPTRELTGDNDDPGS